MTSVRVPGFLPSSSGLHFTNYFPHEPELTIKLPLGGTLPIGDAANGLCGGMVFTVGDYFEAHQPVPPDTQPPAGGSPLYQFIVKRLIDSFNLPFGIARYLELMQPSFPDVGLGFGLPGRAGVMLTDEWPRIQASLDAGHVAPLGLVKIKSAHPEDLCKNHQVLAYGYDLDGTDLTIWLYDPNYPDRDDVRLQLSIANPQAPVSLTYVPDEEVVCFFHTSYTPVAPPAF
ncbi:MAG TPA: hypothetical protein VF937_06345 [Chloroflexota bacterium]